MPIFTIFTRVMTAQAGRRASRRSRVPCGSGWPSPRTTGGTSALWMTMRVQQFTPGKLSHPEMGSAVRTACLCGFSSLEQWVAATGQSQLDVEDKFPLLPNGQHGHEVPLQDSKRFYGQRLGNQPELGGNIFIRLILGFLCFSKAEFADFILVPPESLPPRVFHKFSSCKCSN